MTEERRDHRQEVTNDIIRLLEEGTAPWQRPWNAGEAGRMPYNPTTNKPYRGGNVLALMISSMRRGYTDPRFCTYKQAAEKGWQVRKGEKASGIEFWDVKPGKEAEEGSDDEKRGYLIHRVYSVFNAAQIDGIPALIIEPREPFQIIESGERILTNSGADIRYGGGRACYVPSGDYIRMPERECFPQAPKFYQTALHELAHWTGAEHRLNRLMTGKPFGSPEYAKEEIRADLASLFLSAETGIPFDPADQAGYIQSWIKVLKDDKNEVFRAAADASKATDYILALEKGKAEEMTAQERPSQADRITASRERAVRTR